MSALEVGLQVLLVGVRVNPAKGGQRNGDLFWCHGVTTRQFYRASQFKWHRAAISPCHPVPRGPLQWKSIEDVRLASS